MDVVGERALQVPQHELLFNIKLASVLLFAGWECYQLLPGGRAWWDHAGLLGLARMHSCSSAEELLRLVRPLVGLLDAPVVDLASRKWIVIRIGPCLRSRNVMPS